MPADRQVTPKAGNGAAHLPPASARQYGNGNSHRRSEDALARACPEELVDAAGIVGRKCKPQLSTEQNPQPDLLHAGPAKRK